MGFRGLVFIERLLKSYLTPSSAITIKKNLPPTIAENFGIIAGVRVEGELTGGGIARKGLYGEGCARNVTFLL